MKVRDCNFSLETPKAQLGGRNSLGEKKRVLTPRRSKAINKCDKRNSSEIKFLPVTFSESLPPRYVNEVEFLKILVCQHLESRPMVCTQFILVCTSMYQYVPCYGMIPIYTDINQYVLVHTTTFYPKYVPASMYFLTQVCTFSLKYVLPCTMYILVHTW